VENGAALNFIFSTPSPIEFSTQHFLVAEKANSCLAPL